MDFSPSAKAIDFRDRLGRFMDDNVYPAEADVARQLEEDGRWCVAPAVEALKQRAREEGLWNLFLSDATIGAGLTNVDFAMLCEIMGRSPIAPEIFNCNAPDTGNIETLHRFGTEEQKARWLAPLLDGTIRSAFAMTEPAVASSDATNIEADIRRDGDHYILNGHKWWISGIGSPHCRLIIFMGKTDPDNPDPYKQQSMILVDRDTPGIEIKRMMTLFGYDDAPHGHADIMFRDVRVPANNLLLGEGRGFEIAQARLGPGRIHHCMRLIGAAERCLEAMCRRVQTRKAFGKLLSEQSVTLERIAEARIEIDQTRLLVLHAAWCIDQYGARNARKQISQIKVAAPRMAGRVADWAMQAHGAGGLSQDFGLAYVYARARAMRFADGPDEVHHNLIARFELKGR